MPLIEELGQRGHNVTVLSPIKATKQMKNVKEILTLDTEKRNETFMRDPFKAKEANKQENPFSRVEYFAEVCRDSYDLPIVKQIMEEKFDLVLTQPLLNDCAAGLIHRLGAPLVLFCPVSLPNFLAEHVGGHFPLSYVPHMFVPLHPEMSFRDRIYNFAVEIVTTYEYVFKYLPEVQAVYKEKVGEDVLSIAEVFRNTSLILSNGHFSTHYHKPFLHDIVEVGGLSRKSKTANPLSPELEEFIGRGKKEGFIYFSMGTLIRSGSMPEGKRRIFINVFSQLRQQVIWKWDTENMPDLPGNVKLSKWLPQEDVLGHKDIKMFITHCGGGGTEESIYHGVPMIGIPMFSDQMLNSKLAQSHGISLEIDWTQLTEERLLSAIHEILGNQKYSKNVKRLSAIYKDQPQDPMTRVVYWVEYVMRHKGAPHMRTAGRKLNFLQYHSFDVIAAYLTLISLVLYLVYKIMSCVLRAICGRSSSKKSERE